MTLASCGDDEDDPVVQANRAPTVEIQNADGSPNDSLKFDDVQAGTAVAVTIVTADADANLNSIEFDVDGVRASVGNVRVGDATTPITDNPLLLVDNKGGSSTVYYFSAPVTPGESIEYTVTVKDDDGESASEDFTVAAAVPLTTLDGILLNSAGPSGTGGLVLSTGQTVNSTDTLAGIIDLGIDDKIDGQVSENWRQQVGPGQTSILHEVAESFLTEGQTFADITTKSQIQAAYGSTGVDVKESKKIETGAVLAVLQNDVYYLLEVAEVRVANQSNADQYTFNIKF